MNDRFKFPKALLLFSLATFSLCKPDLVVENLTHTPGCPGTKDQITFTATVKNIGSDPAGASAVSFKVGGESNPAVFPVPPLGPGNTFTVTRQIVLNVAQNYQNTVIADINNTVNESNEGNNKTIDLYTVGCCIPPYSPSYWNDGGTVQYNNNCYNYGNNKRTDTYAQPGEAAGAKYTMPITCGKIQNAVMADGLTPLPSSGVCPSGKDKIAVFVAPCVAPNCKEPYYSGNDYHWYRQGSDGKWTHKPGGGQATNLDNSGNVITNPETADRCGTYCYSEFCGYYCSCSSSEQGQGHENIK